LPVRAFAFADEPVDPRGDNSESIREQAGSGTEPSSSTASSARVRRIPDHMIAKFIHHKRLMMETIY
jgi:hypothetical protein